MTNEVSSWLKIESYFKNAASQELTRLRIMGKQSLGFSFMQFDSGKR